MLNQQKLDMLQYTSVLHSLYVLLLLIYTASSMYRDAQKHIFISFKITYIKFNIDLT